jgi:holo-[acyl-carrier protein] synthase
MVLTGGAAAQLQRITPAGFEARVDVSLTDDFPLAQAIVVISGIPVAGNAPGFQPASAR